MSDNPFQSPQVSPTDETVEKQPARATAPASITVFGVLNLVFGALGVCGVLFAVLGLVLQNMDIPQQPQNQGVEVLNQHPIYGPFQTVNVGINFVMTFVLLLAGIGLLKKRSFGRTLSNTYGVFAILSVLINIFLLAVFLRGELFALPPENGLPIGMIIFWSAIGGGLVGMVYPVLLLIFINRPRVKAALQ